MLYTVGVQLGVGDLKVDDRVDLHGDVILGDDGLGGEVHHLLLEGDGLGHPLDKGDLEVDAHAPDGVESAQTFDDVGLGLLHHPDVGGQNEDDEHDQDDGYDETKDSSGHNVTSL